jgi:threonine/homoserine/homoserine lactone efflux protein
LDQVLWTFLFGVGFGLAATIPPGPINTEIARRTLKFGWLPGLAFGLGSIAVENVLAAFSCMGYGLHLDDYPAMMPVLFFVGFVVLAAVGTIAFVNGYRAWQDPTRAALQNAGENLEAIHASPGLPKTQLASAPRSFLAGIGMAIISPYTIAFWIIALPSAAHRTIDTKQHAALLLLGIVVGTCTWIWGFTTMLSWLKRYSSTWWIIWADLIGGVMLLAFAA